MARVLGTLCGYEVCLLTYKRTNTMCTLLKRGYLSHVRIGVTSVRLVDKVVSGTRLQSACWMLDAALCRLVTVSSMSLVAATAGDH